MQTVTSKDGTKIAFEKVGAGTASVAGASVAAGSVEASVAGASVIT